MSPLRPVTLRRFRAADAPDGFFDELRALLDTAFASHPEDGSDDEAAGGFAEEDWQHGLGGVHVAAYEAGELVAHAAVVPRRLYVGDRVLAAGYVENVATRPDRQRRGLGAAVMREVGRVLGPGGADGYDVGALSASASAFYRRLGWLSWQGPAHVVHPSGWVRTPEEDDAVMVLPLPGRPPVDLAAPVAVDPRPGDDW